jgi:hypothetical protein
VTPQNQSPAVALPSVLSCLARLVTVKISLKMRGLGPTLTRYNRSRSDFRRDDTVSDEVIDQTAFQVAGAAALFPGRALCLEQTLVLHGELRRIGVESRIRFGVTPYPFNAHTWIEVRGRPVNENLHWLGQMTLLEA